jgi:hypothetical protein
MRAPVQVLDLVRTTVPVPLGLLLACLVPLRGDRVVQPVATVPQDAPPAATPPAEVPALRVILSLEDSIGLEDSLPSVAVRRRLEGYFGRFNDDRVLVRRIARAVVRESRREQVAASLIAAVVVTENTTLIPEAESQVGAQGLMQVMPMHAGQLGCASDDLVDVDSNICHGTRILARNLRRTGSPFVALLRYNGCVKGTNTPDCHRYPAQVLNRAGRVRHEILGGTVAKAVTLPQLAQPVQLAQR